jgi:hypothetical protein
LIQDLELTFKNMRRKDNPEGESAPDSFSFKTTVAKTDPNMAVIKASAPSAKGSSNPEMNSTMVDRILQLLPQQYVKPTEKAVDLV